MRVYLRLQLILLLLLALAAVACTQGARDDSAATTDAASVPGATVPVAPEPRTDPEGHEAVASPAATPGIAEGFVPAVSESLGVTLRYPPSWTAEDRGAELRVGFDPTSVNATPFPAPGTLLVAPAPLDQAGVEIETALMNVLAEVPFADPERVVEGPTAMAINGEEAAAVVVAAAEGTGIDGPLHLTLIRGSGNAVLALSQRPMDSTEQVKTILEAIVQTITLTPRPGPIVEGDVRFGERMQGAVLPLRPSIWTFTGAADERINLLATPLDESLNLVLDVVGPAGESILAQGALNASPGAEQIRGLPLPEDGAYRVIIDGAEGGAGSYELLVGRVGEIVGEPMFRGDVVNGAVEPGEVDLYTLIAIESAPLVLAVVPEEDLDVVVSVTDAFTGELIAEEDAAFGRESLVFTPIAGADYIIRVSGFADAGGTYRISLLENPEVAGSTILAGDRLEPGAQGHAFPFSALEGALTTVSVTSEPGLDVLLEVWQDDGETLLERVDLDAGFETLSFLAPATGNYFFLVRPQPGTAGTYDISLNGTDGIIFEITYGDVVQGTLGEEGALEYFLRLNPGETVQLDVASERELDPVLEILDRDEQLIAERDIGYAGEPESLRFTAPGTVSADTTFIVRVRNFVGAGDGRFTLQVTSVD